MHIRSIYCVTWWLSDFQFNFVKIWHSWDAKWFHSETPNGYIISILPNPVGAPAVAQVLLDEYLRRQLGPKQANIVLSVCLSTLYALLFVVGFFGNFLTALIILFNSYMRVPPNFFLLSLAIADMITVTAGKFPDFLHTIFSLSKLCDMSCILLKKTQRFDVFGQILQNNLLFVIHGCKKILALFYF